MIAALPKVKQFKYSPFLKLSFFDKSKPDFAYSEAVLGSLMRVYCLAIFSSSNALTVSSFCELRMFFKESSLGV
jgi:hypothetical protein